MAPKAGIVLALDSEEMRKASLREMWNKFRGRGNSRSGSGQREYAEQSELPRERIEQGIEEVDQPRASEPYRLRATIEDYTHLLAENFDDLPFGKIIAEGMIAQQKLKSHAQMSSSGADGARKYLEEDKNSGFIFPWSPEEKYRDLADRFILNPDQIKEEKEKYLKWVGLCAYYGSNYEHGGFRNLNPLPIGISSGSTPDLLFGGNLTNDAQWYDFPDFHEIRDVAISLYRDHTEILYKFVRNSPNIAYDYSRSDLEDRERIFPNFYQFDDKIKNHYSATNYVQNSYPLHSDGMGGCPLWHPLSDENEKLDKEWQDLTNQSLVLDYGDPRNEEINNKMEEISSRKREISKQVQDEIHEKLKERVKEQYGEHADPMVSMVTPWVDDSHGQPIPLSEAIDGLRRSRHHSGYTLYAVPPDQVDSPDITQRMIDYDNGVHELRSLLPIRAGRTRDENAYGDASEQYERYIANIQNAQNAASIYGGSGSSRVSDPYDESISNKTYELFSSSEHPEIWPTEDQKVASVSLLSPHEGLHPELDAEDESGRTIHDLSQQQSQDWYGQATAQAGRRLPEEGVSYSSDHGYNNYIRFGPYVMGFQVSNPRYDRMQFYQDLKEGKPWTFDEENKVWRRNDGEIAPHTRVASVATLLQYRHANDEEKNILKYADIVGKAFGRLRVNHVSFSPASSSTAVRAGLPGGSTRTRLFNMFKNIIIKKFRDHPLLSPHFSIKRKTRSGRTIITPSLSALHEYTTSMRGAGAFSTDESDRIQRNPIARNASAKLILANFRGMYDVPPPMDPTYIGNIEKHADRIFRATTSDRRYLKVPSHLDIHTDISSRLHSAYGVGARPPTTETSMPTMPKPNWHTESPMLERSLVFDQTLRKASLIERWRKFRNRGKPEGQSRALETRSSVSQEPVRQEPVRREPFSPEYQGPVDEYGRPQLSHDDVLRICSEGHLAERMLKMHYEATHDKSSLIQEICPGSLINVFDKDDVEKFIDSKKLNENQLYEAQKKVAQWITLLTSEALGADKYQKEHLIKVDTWFPSLDSELPSIIADNKNNIMELPNAHTEFKYLVPIYKDLCKSDHSYNGKYAEQINHDETSVSKKLKIMLILSDVRGQDFRQGRPIGQRTTFSREVKTSPQNSPSLLSALLAYFPRATSEVRAVPPGHKDYEKYIDVETNINIAQENRRSYSEMLPLWDKLEDILASYRKELREKFKEKLRKMGINPDYSNSYFGNLTHSKNLSPTGNPEMINMASKNDPYYWEHLANSSKEANSYQYDSEPYEISQGSIDPPLLDDLRDSAREELMDETGQDYDDIDEHDLAEKMAHHNNAETHISLGPDDQEDEERWTNHDRQQSISKDYYNQDLAATGRRAHVSDVIYHAPQFSGYIIRSGPYVFNFEVQPPVLDTSQLHHDVFWGKPWKWDQQSQEFVLPDGSKVPGQTTAYVNSLVQYRKHREGEKGLAHYASAIMDALKNVGINNIDFSPAYSTTVINGRSVGGASRQRLFGMIINQGQKEAMETDPDYSPPFITKEKGQRVPSVRAHWDIAARRAVEAVPLPKNASAVERGSRTALSNPALRETALDFSSPQGSEAIKTRLGFAAREHEGIDPDYTASVTPESKWNLGRQEMQRSFSKNDIQLLKSLWKTRKNK